MPSYWDKVTPPPTTAGPDPSTLRIAILGGTGRMGVHLGAHWANIGMDVMLCSRTPPSAQKIVDTLKLGRGYRAYAKAGGEIDVPPPRNPAGAAAYKLSAGSVTDAASADIIVLATMFDNQWAQLEQIKAAIKGKGKIIIDMTNPFLMRPDDGANGIPASEMPAGGPAAVLVHQQKLGDDSVKWACAFKHTLWSLILPDGPAKSFNGVEVLGDDVAVATTISLLERGGWTPRYRGQLQVAPLYEPMGPKAHSMLAAFFTPSGLRRFIGDKLACM